MQCDCIVGHHIADGQIKTSELCIYLARSVNDQEYGYTRYNFCPICGKVIDLDYWVGRLEYEYAKEIGLAD